MFADFVRVGLKTHKIGSDATALVQWCASGFTQDNAWTQNPGQPMKVNPHLQVGVVAWLQGLG